MIRRTWYPCCQLMRTTGGGWSVLTKRKRNSRRTVIKRLDTGRDLDLEFPEQTSDVFISKTKRWKIRVKQLKWDGENCYKLKRKKPLIKFCLFAQKEKDTAKSWLQLEEEIRDINDLILQFSNVVVVSSRLSVVCRLFGGGRGGLCKNCRTGHLHFQDRIFVLTVSALSVLVQFRRMTLHRMMTLHCTRGPKDLGLNLKDQFSQVRDWSSSYRKLFIEKK